MPPDTPNENDPEEVDVTELCARLDALEKFKADTEPKLTSLNEDMKKLENWVRQFVQKNT